MATSAFTVSHRHVAKKFTFILLLPARSALNFLEKAKFNIGGFPLWLLNLDLLCLGLLNLAIICVHLAEVKARC
ncbi:protein of unknown function [Vibrio tapetis subsp. tapetis]|uniref:Uncharacterized protein n=1 Tax=Vibrio tapetis subsp. tapetis TaxID=1671868 RepID=A0A2N8ZM63_9VIBR|nr:protein of unknown function [Vibrio tapetis subsp. tapetis]